MSIDTHISLIDLTKQLKFHIDETLKSKIIFGETLLISCAHYEGEISKDDGVSDWSSSESVVSEPVKDSIAPVERKLTEEVKQPDKKEEEENDFQIYFFPDCKKPKLPRDSKASIITEDGMPKINPINRHALECTCPNKDKGECTCFFKIPCECGAKLKNDCTCHTLKEICICKHEPHTTCTCKGSRACLCFPEGIKAVCSCERVNVPCICNKEQYPHPVCVCPKKDTEKDDFDFTEQEFAEEENSESLTETVAIPCTCQKPTLDCFCPEGTNCKHSKCNCTCPKPCMCSSADENENLLKDKKDTNTNICVCEEQQESTCVCFPKETKECTCGDKNNCKCFSICDCENPCLCDLKPKVEPECTCPDRLLADLNVCTCLKKGNEDLKLKKVRQGKSGYRWCHDVDPRHTYFDYGYGRHDKISEKHEILQKFKIMGLHEEETILEECPIHKAEPPKFIKKVRKPTLDCCSTVGGISFSVESLGEDKDKFLVQVVSHSSKEGAKTGFKLVSILDTKLHTLEENRTEYITKKNLTKERRSYVAVCESGYYNKVTRVYGERSVVKRIYHGFETANKFLLEGANVVLLRYFAVTHYKGTVQTESLLMNGKVCQSIYVSYGMTQGVVNGRPMFVVKVERHIIEPSGVLHQTLTVLSLRGYIISHEWADNAYIFHINPLLRINPEKDIIETHEPLRENWRQDLQLLSDYLDFKSDRSSENARYMAESGNLTNTVRDYLQSILLLKPPDALHFTKHYFESMLSAMDLPRNEHFDPSVKRVRYHYFEN